MVSPPSAAIVLAGGKSTRLGRDKASERLLGRPLLQHVLDRLAGVVDECVIVKARGQLLPETRSATRIVVVEDEYPEVGPLGGIFTGLKAMEASFAVTVACDMPLLQPALVRELLHLAPGNDVVVPQDEDYPQTLCAVYAKTCIEPIRRQIEAGRYKITGFFPDVRVRYLPPEEWRQSDPEGVSFQNLNREEDLDRARELLLAEERPGA